MIVSTPKSALSNAVLLFGGAALSGFAVPVIAVAVMSMIIYFPIGSGLPESLGVELFANALGAFIVLLAVTAGVLLAGVVNSLIARRWRPLILALLFGLGVCLGFVPGQIVGSSLRAWAFESFSQRSMSVVDAIERYMDATGKPPDSLLELVPTYLPAVPKTGMAAYPNYEYKAMSGECSEKNRWYLWVDVSEFIDMNQLLYCPVQDYEPAPMYVLSRSRIGPWVHDRIVF